MNIDLIVRLTAALIGFSIALSCLEYIFLFNNKLFSSVWNYKNLENELVTNLPFPKKLTQFFFGDESFKILVTLQMVLAVSLISNMHFLLVLALLIIQILICIRFRGTFNGGSDSMTVVLLTGLIISLASPTSIRAGLIYISVNVIFSYFKAGLVKFKNRQWIEGKALGHFLQMSPLIFTKNVDSNLQNQKVIFQLISAAVIAFEMGSIALIVVPKLTVIYMCVALLFHFLIFVGFGLNRFFWVWLAAWPATYYSISLLG